MVFSSNKDYIIHSIFNCSLFNLIANKPIDNSSFIGDINLNIINCLLFWTLFFYLF